MTRYWESPSVALYLGDAREVLAQMELESVHCVVTSPPYWGLRDYQLEPSAWGGDSKHSHQWGVWQEDHDTREATSHGKTRTTERFYGEESRRFDGNHQKHAAGSNCYCGAWLGTLGLEPTPELYVEHIVEVFREVWRVMRKDGTLWLNMGDSYARAGGWSNNAGLDGQSRAEGTRPHSNVPTGTGSSQKLALGLKEKDLIGMPWRVAFALQADGWWLRSDIIWAKLNPMPESVTDRPTSSHEYLFLLTKAARYFYDQEAIREAAQNWGPRDRSDAKPVKSGGFHTDLTNGNCSASGRNKRSVWTIATEPFPEAHFATFPQKLVEPCILAGTSEGGVCPECGAPWTRVVEKIETGETQKMADGWDTGSGGHGTIHRDGREAGESGRPVTRNETAGWRPTCDCGREDTVPATVLDPFSGAGTTALVAQKLGRRGIGIDLSASYLDMAVKRLEAIPMPMRLT